MSYADTLLLHILPASWIPSAPIIAKSRAILRQDVWGAPEIGAYGAAVRFAPSSQGSNAALYSVSSAEKLSNVARWMVLAERPSKLRLVGRGTRVVTALSLDRLAHRR